MTRTERTTFFMTLFLLLAGAAALLLLRSDTGRLEREALLRREAAFAAADLLEEGKARAAAGAYTEAVTESAVRGEVALRLTVFPQTGEAGILYTLSCEANAGGTALFCGTALYVPFSLEAVG